MMTKENLSKLEQILDEDVQNSYAWFFEKGYIHPLKNKVDRYGIMPDYQTVRIKSSIQKGYFILLERTFFDEAKELKEFTGIGPDFDTAQKVYLGNIKWVTLRNMKTILKFTGINPDYNFPGMKDAIHKGHIDSFEHGFFRSVKDMNEFTGIKPDYNSKEIFDAIQKCYLTEFNLYTYYDRGTNTTARINLINVIKEINEFTGIKPCKEVIAKYPKYADMFKD